MKTNPWRPRDLTIQRTGQDRPVCPSPTQSLSDTPDQTVLFGPFEPTCLPKVHKRSLTSSSGLWQPILCQEMLLQMKLEMETQKWSWMQDMMCDISDRAWGMLCGWRQAVAPVWRGLRQNECYLCVHSLLFLFTSCLSSFLFLFTCFPIQSS